jgi:hypothetical protein
MEMNKVSGLIEDDVGDDANNDVFLREDSLYTVEWLDQCSTRSARRCLEACDEL